jgi:hypothetical protein
MHTHKGATRPDCMENTHSVAGAKSILGGASQNFALQSSRSHSVGREEKAEAGGCWKRGARASIVGNLCDSKLGGGSLLSCKQALGQI